MDNPDTELAGIPIINKQGTSGSTTTDLAGLTMTDLAQAWATEIGQINVTAALQQAAFLICCDVIAQDMAKAPLQLRERLANGTSRIVPAAEHPIAALLAREPNRRHTWFEFQEMMGLWHALESNSFAIVFRNSFGEPEEIVPVMPGHVQDRVAGRSIFYDVTAGTSQELALLGSAYLLVPERDMIHVRGRMLNGMDGYSTLVAGRKTLETGNSIEKYRNELFGEGGQIRGVFRRDWAQGGAGIGILPDEAFTRLRMQLKAMMRKFGAAHEPLVLEGGLQFQPIASTPADAELTKQFEAQIVATCRLLRMPPHKAFHLVNVKYENLDTMEKAYVGDTMDPILQRHEQRYSRALLTTEERTKFFLHHDREALWLTDYKAETERVVKLVGSGVMSVNEGRARVGMNPRDGGDVYMVPSANHVLDESNNIVVEPPKPEPAPQPADSSKTGDVLRLVKG